MSLTLYNALSDNLRHVFGGPVRKVPFSLGLTCPNRDGTKGTGGCVFCSHDELLPHWRVRGEGVRRQVTRGITATGGHCGTRYIAYLQDHTGTWCEPSVLADACREALAVDGVVGLSIGTRPDCITGAMWRVLEDLAATTHLWLELGLQTSDDRTLERLNRNHTAQVFADAAQEAARRGVAVVAHVMLGLPGEGAVEAEATAAFLAGTGVAGVKLHNTLVIRGTRLTGAALSNGRRQKETTPRRPFKI